jgi:hypothetical protein
VQQLGSDRIRALRDEHEGWRLFAHPLGNGSYGVNLTVMTSPSTMR